MLFASDASPVTLYFNSFGWNDLYALNSSTGEMALLPPVSTANTGFINFADGGPDGKIYGTSSSNRLHSIDVSSSPVTWHGVTTLATTATHGLTWSPAGELYAATVLEFHKVNPSNGQTVAGTSVNPSAALRAIEFGSAGTLYGAGSTKLYTVNVSTGECVELYTLPDLTHSFFAELDFGADGMLRALSSTSYLFTFNLQTATGSWSSTKLMYGDSLISPSSLASVPEPPAAIILMAFSAIAIFPRIVRQMLLARCRP